MPLTLGRMINKCAFQSKTICLDIIKIALHNILDEIKSLKTMKLELDQ
jgi:hypothetical protein